MRRLLILSMLLLPAGLAAQTVRGRLTVAGGAPVTGAIVDLVDGSGSVVARVLSSPLGSYSLSARSGGEFTLRVLRVGFPAWSSRSFPLAAGAPAELSAELPEEAIVLAEIEVSGRGACQVGADEGSATATLLEEVGKALGSAELALRDREFTFQMVKVSAKTDEDGTRASLDSVIQLLYTWPIRSLSAARLRDGGFVQRESAAGLEMMPLDASDGYIWFGPDASTLLAGPFLESHCFRVAQDRGDSTRVGLSFTPARGRRKADIAGTLWVDRASLAVRSLTYEYVNVPPGLPKKGAKGEMEFLRLPNGIWLVSRWTIVAPREMQARGQTVGAAGWQEDIGYIREIRRVGGEVIYAPPPRTH